MIVLLTVLVFLITMILIFSEYVSLQSLCINMNSPVFLNHWCIFLNISEHVSYTSFILQHKYLTLCFFWSSKHILWFLQLFSDYTFPWICPSILICSFMNSLRWMGQRNPAPVENGGLSHYFVGVSTIPNWCCRISLAHPQYLLQWWLYNCIYSS